MVRVTYASVERVRYPSRVYAREGKCPSLCLNEISETRKLPQMLSVYSDYKYILLI